MKKIYLLLTLFLIIGCNQDSPNITQIQNMQYFIDNSQNPDIIEVENGLQYSIILNGDINNPTANLDDIITAHFHGTLTNGDVFWSSVDMNEPLEIPLSGLIEGCQKIISLMRTGDKWKVFIDPSMAYGDEGRPGIPSNSILIFEIELLEIASL